LLFFEYIYQDKKTKWVAADPQARAGVALEGDREKEGEETAVEAAPRTKKSPRSERKQFGWRVS